MDPETNDAGEQRVEQPTVTRRRLLATGGATLGAGIGIAGCVGLDDAADESRTASHETITVTDHVGRTVTVSQPVEELVLLNTRLYWAATLLGIEDRVLATTGETEEFPSLADKPGAGWWRDPNVEQIIELDPEVLVTRWTGEGAREEIDALASKLEPFDIDVVAIELDGLQLDGARLFGQLVGKADELDDFLEWTHTQVHQVKNRLEEIPATDRPLVYCENQHGDWEGVYAGTVHIAGGRNLLESVVDDLHELRIGTTKTLDREYVIEQDPEFVLIDDSGGPPVTTGYEVDDPADALALREEFMQRSGTEHLSAVQTDEVHTVEFKTLRGEKAWLGVLYLAKLFHPDRFDDLDPVSVHREYLEEWLGVPHRGVYLAPAYL
ncbi:ABC transporter substrate-binding protein [Natronobeatus ordinarius]|uniref:ABC transporter substrate-binding protein n=1 Tax=Natronobeatus ordinarius TaxID=2963433 RepID=UPI0020CE5A54|nr:ABC transporter substrate-binding protein [Natronobeatus ordinarius]